MTRKRTENNISLPMVGKQLRIGLPSGQIRAGVVVAEYDDALVVEDGNGQTGIIYRQWVVEMWEGYGKQEEQIKESEQK